MNALIYILGCLLCFFGGAALGVGIGNDSSFSVAIGICAWMYGAILVFRATAQFMNGGSTDAK